MNLAAGNDDDDDDDDEDDKEEPWRRNARSHRAPRDERVRKNARGDEEDDDSDNSDEWGDQEEDIWLQGIDLSIMDGLSDTQPQGGESQGKGTCRAGGGLGWGDSIHEERGESIEIMRLTESEEEQMRKSFVWEMT